jgi:hypothetical protein
VPELLHINTYQNTKLKHDNTLILNLNDVLDASTSTNILKVLGNDGDSVNASGFAKISGVETEG